MRYHTKVDFAGVVNLLQIIRETDERGLQNIAMAFFLEYQAITDKKRQQIRLVKYMGESGRQ